MIPEFTVSPKLLENMLSIRVAEVLVILVGYVMFGNNEFVVNDMHAPIKTIADNKLTTREHQSETHCNINNPGSIYRQVHKLVRNPQKICVYDQNFVFGDV